VLFVNPIMVLIAVVIQVVDPPAFVVVGGWLRFQPWPVLRRFSIQPQLPPRQRLDFRNGMEIVRIGQETARQLVPVIKKIIAIYLENSVLAAGVGAGKGNVNKCAVPDLYGMKFLVAIVGDCINVSVRIGVSSRVRRCISSHSGENVIAFVGGIGYAEQSLQQKVDFFTHSPETIRRYGMV